MNIVIGYACGLVAVFLLKKKLEGWSKAGQAHAQVRIAGLYLFIGPTRR